MHLAPRTTSILAMLLVADGASFLVAPDAMLRFWSSARAPAWWTNALEYFDTHRGVARALAAGEVMTGLALLRSASPSPLAVS